MLRFGCGEMSDGDFLRAFQDKGIPSSRFHHGDHLRLGWLLLERLPVDDATDAACRGLRAFAHRNGSDLHYHETLTRGWMRLLAMRDERNFADYAAVIDGEEAAGNPLHRHWSPELLETDAARTGYVEPDRDSLPPVSPRWRVRATSQTPVPGRCRSIRSRLLRRTVHWPRRAIHWTTGLPARNGNQR